MISAHLVCGWGALWRAQGQAACGHSVHDLHGIQSTEGALPRPHFVQNHSK